MARTAYCKRCGREVDAGEVCPFCGTRLGKNAGHVAWCAERTPVKDWMYWNSVMRLLLPGTLVILVLVLLAELISGGIGAVEQMLASAFLPVLGILLAGVLAGVFLVLLAQGKELSDFVIDSRGIHETRYLPDATPLKLALRLKAPKMPEDGNIVRLGEHHVAWKDVTRVQLWPEKCMVLFYAPAWWLRIPAVCTPFNWEDVMEFIREKLGRKRKVHLPQSLTVQAPATPRRRQASAYREPEAVQIRMDETDFGEQVPAAETPDTASTET